MGKAPMGSLFCGRHIETAVVVLARASSLRDLMAEETDMGECDESQPTAAATRVQNLEVSIAKDSG